MEKCHFFLSTLTLGLLALICQVEGRIKVMSTIDDETVYLVREKPIITNIDSPLKGMLVLANPVNACQPIIPAPDQILNSSLGEWRNSSSSTERLGVRYSTDFAWVLLVSWSPAGEIDCPVRTKAENAMAAGYSVMLLQDPTDYDQEADAMSPLLAPLSPPRTSFEISWIDVNVYACTINPVDWDVLRINFTSEQYYLNFEDGNSMSGWFTYFIVGILVIGAVFFTIGLSYVLVQLLVLILIWIRESIVSRIQQVRRDRRRRLPASQLRKIPIQQWNSDMLQDICSICLESYDVSDRVRILPCSHVFHSACIDPWLLKQRRKCPNCKRKIVFPDENRDSDSSSDDERTPLLRDSTTRESFSSSAGTSPRTTVPTSPEATQGRTAGGGGRPVRNANCPIHSHQRRDPRAEPGHNQSNINLNQENSSINASSEVTGNETGAQNTALDLKGKVDQLCARMENVGKKIKKKVKANHASKLDNDSSSDLSTSVHPVLVSVTVEPNHLPDTDTDGSLPNNEESHNEHPHFGHYNFDSEEKNQPSSSRNIDRSISDHSDSTDQTSNNFSSNTNNNSEIEVKVVPEQPSANNGESHLESDETSILSDLNA